jgi:predicted nucleic acid-binding protein
MGIPLVGVCGLLVIARRQRWISNVHDVLTAMKRDGYYIAPSLVHKVLQLAGEE